MENGVPLSLENDFIQLSADLTSSGSGNVLVFWTRDNGLAWDKVGQRIDLAGNLLWGEQGIILPQYYGGSVQISDQSQGAVITGNANLGIYSQRIDTNGTFLWPGLGVQICDTINAPQTTRMAEGLNSIYYIWRNGLEQALTRIYIQRVSLEGLKLWDPEGLIVSYPRTECRTFHNGDGRWRSNRHMVRNRKRSSCCPEDRSGG